MAAADARTDAQADARVLARLSAVVESRRGGDPDASYTARLFAGGTAGIARKVGEEAVETVVAALSGDRAAAVEESADLLFHLTVLWADAGIAPEEVFAALARREGVSGLDEKRARGKGGRGKGEGGRLMAYDDDNVFAKILRGEIPADKAFEDEHVLAFHDIARLAPAHVLVIPKGKYTSLDDFAARASAAEQAALVRAVGRVAREFGVAESGFRAVSNNGPDGGQEVPHFHVHVLGGRKLAGMERRT